MILRRESERYVGIGRLNGSGGVYGFLTCQPNAAVEPVHPKAMPVILTEPEEIETWMTAPWGVARGLQRPLDDDRLITIS